MAQIISTDAETHRAHMKKVSVGKHRRTKSCKTFILPPKHEHVCVSMCVCLCFRDKKLHELDDILYKQPLAIQGNLILLCTTQVSPKEGLADSSVDLLCADLKSAPNTWTQSLRFVAVESAEPVSLASRLMGWCDFSWTMSFCTSWEMNLQSPRCLFLWEPLNRKWLQLSLRFCFRLLVGPPWPSLVSISWGYVSPRIPENWIL